MPNPPHYRNRVTFGTSFEGDFLREFKKKCSENGKTANEVLTQFMNQYLRSDNEQIEQQILNPLNLPLAENSKNSTLQPITENTGSDKDVRFNVSKYPDAIEWLDHFKEIHTVEEAGEILRYFRSTFQLVQTQFNRINSTTPKVRRRY